MRKNMFYLSDSKLPQLIISRSICFPVNVIFNLCYCHVCIFVTTPHCPSSGLLLCFPAVVKRAATDIDANYFCGKTCSPTSMPRSSGAESYGSSTFNFRRNRRADFHKEPVKIFGACDKVSILVNDDIISNITKPCRNR